MLFSIRPSFSQAQFYSFPLCPWQTKCYNKGNDNAILSQTENFIHGGIRMKKTTWLSLLLTAVMLLTCLSLAFADDIGLHNIVTKTYPFYTGKTLDSILDQEFPLYFLDGVDV